MHTDDLPIAYTVFPDLGGGRRDQFQTPWGQLSKLLCEPPTYSSKREMPLIKLALFGDFRTGKGSYRHDGNVIAVTGIEADYDGGTISPDEAAARLKAAGIEAVIYTTPSHTQSSPRWRVMCPLANPVAPEARKRLVGMLNHALGGVLASESFTISQAFYYGCAANTEFKSIRVHGETIDSERFDLFHPPAYPDGLATRPAASTVEALDIATREADRARVNSETIEDLRNALAHLASEGIGASYPDWMAIGQALASLKGTPAEEQARELWVEYCAACPKYEGPDSAARKWDYHLKGDRSGYTAIFTRAQRAGWLNPRSALSLNDEERGASDVELSRILARAMEGRFLYVKNGAGWMYEANGVWKSCARGEEVEEAKSLGARIWRERNTLDGAKNFDVAIKLVKRAKSAGGIKAALELTQSDPRISVSVKDFDRELELLNVINGIVHLPSGALREHDAALRMSRQCQAQYIPDAVAPQWDQFMSDVSCNDSDWVDYLQRAVGYTLSGHVREEILFFLLGNGANGKSVFANVLRRILGNYATSVPPSFLMASQRDGEAATPALATLPGARLALANEIEGGSRLSAQMVKVACSTEEIAARPLYRDIVRFVPTHKLWIRANHKPIITDNDEGIWRRIALIPFDRHFSADERDPLLEEKLMSEASGILAWAVRGYREYLNRGLKPASRVAAASAQYRSESDLLGQWALERTAAAASFECVQSHAYFDYRAWCGEQGLRPMAKRSFTRGLIERGIKEGRRSTGLREHIYKGFQLMASVPDVPHQGSFSEILPKENPHEKFRETVLIAGRCGTDL